LCSWVRLRSNARVLCCINSEMTHARLKGRGKAKGRGVKQTMKQELQKKKTRKLSAKTPKKAEKIAARRAAKLLAASAEVAERKAEVAAATMEVDPPVPAVKADAGAPKPKLNKKELRMQANTERKHRSLFAKSDRVLLVGEGNFSFARALCEHLGEQADMIATAYDSEHLLNTKYEDAAATRKMIESELGGTTLVGVDATKLHRMSEFRGAFSTIVWNFPHLGGGETDTEKNVADHQALLTSFFKSAVRCLDANKPSAIHVALKTGEPYKSWKVVQMAQAACPELKLAAVEQFSTTAWPGYAHRRTAGFDARFSKDDSEELAKGARVYVFELRPEALADE